MMQDRAYPTLAKATLIWARIGLLSFGGPAGQIVLMHRILVEEQHWLGRNGSFMHSTIACYCRARKRLGQTTVIAHR